MTDSIHPEIVSDPRVMFGKPVIAGTRITVELILDHLAAGEPIEQLLTEYPRLTRAAIYSALKFAAESLRREVASAPAGQESAQ